MVNRFSSHRVSLCFTGSGLIPGTDELNSRHRATQAGGALAAMPSVLRHASARGAARCDPSDIGMGQ